MPKLNWKHNKKTVIEKLFISLFMIMTIGIMGVSATEKSILKKGNPLPKIQLAQANGSYIYTDKLAPLQNKLFIYLSLKSKLALDTIRFFRTLKSKTENLVQYVIVSTDDDLSLLSAFRYLEKEGFILLQDQSKQGVKQLQIFILPTIFLVETHGKLINLYVDLSSTNETHIYSDINQLTGLQLKAPAKNSRLRLPF